jgi:error-prone DNA polymerase
LILDDARQFGIAILGLDINQSDDTYRIERVGVLDEPPPAILDEPPRRLPELQLPDGRAYGIRMALSDVKGITQAEIERIVAGRPYASLSDFWHRAAASRPIVERLVVAGGFDALYDIGGPVSLRRRGQMSRRDLLLQIAELDAWTRAVARGARSRRTGRAAADRADTVTRANQADVVARAARQSRAAAPPPPVDVQLTLDLGDAPAETPGAGLPEMTVGERVRAELEVLGLDVTDHVLRAYEPFLDALGVVRSKDLLGCRSRQEILVAGVKVATQTPPIRSGRRVVFVTLDDATGPLDATFFEDAQVGYASTVFHSWLLVIRGIVRRTGPRGISLNATGCWELPALQAAWEAGGLADVAELMRSPAVVSEQAVRGAAESRSTRPVVVPPPVGGGSHLHPTGFRSSPYSDIRPSGHDPRAAPRRLWHSSPGSSGG